MLRNGEKFGLVENQEGYDGGQDIRPYGELRNIHSKMIAEQKQLFIPHAAGNPYIKISTSQAYFSM